MLTLGYIHTYVCMHKNYVNNNYMYLLLNQKNTVVEITSVLKTHESLRLYHFTLCEHSKKICDLTACKYPYNWNEKQAINMIQMSVIVKLSSNYAIVQFMCTYICAYTKTTYLCRNLYTHICMQFDGTFVPTANL